MISIRKSFSTKLTLTILVLAIPIFVIALGIFFSQSRNIVRKEAVERASSMLNTTMHLIYRNISAIETATNSCSWQINQNIQPDSVQALSRRLVQLNPHLDGCSISMEPDYYPQYGRHFSAYTVRQEDANGRDSVATVIEEPYEYFYRIWYKSPKDLGKPCWLVYFDDADSLNLSLDGLLASYCVPLYDANGHFFSVISTDLSLLRLSKIISQEKPYPNSYYMMLDKEGHYFIHPDSTRLFTKTIFSDADPSLQSDIFALGHEMTNGVRGCMTVNIDGQSCIVCYQPIPDTSWSLAIVCHDSDVLARYYMLTHIIIPLIVIGLIIILLLCHRAVGQAIRPINQLLEKTQSIAAGNMEVHIPRSRREDSVGRLQNSFATMLQAINFHMGSVRYTTEQTKHRNEDLAHATRLAQEADQQKTAFIQDVSHQIRTPLNIIMGFAQVLSDANADMTDGLSEEEKKSITTTMSHNSQLLNRMLMMLFDSSDTGLAEELKAHKHDRVSCNEVARDSISYILLYYPSVHVNFQTEVGDDFCVETNQLYLMRSLRELLYNSAKYSDGQHVTLSVKANDSTVRFTVEDTGPGITEADQEQIFKFFTKVDDLSEGLGLGLPLAKRHALNLGGDLYLDTTYHGGCRFVIELPLKNDSNEENSQDNG